MRDPGSEDDKRFNLDELDALLDDEDLNALADDDGSEEKSDLKAAEDAVESRGLGQVGSPERMSLVIGLKSSRSQIELELIPLRRREAELQRSRARLEQGARDVSAMALLSKTKSDLRLIGEQIALRESEIAHLAAEITELDRRRTGLDVGKLLAENDRLAAELDDVRADVLTSLRALARPLRQFQGLADRKSRLVRKAAAAAERDLSYRNYLDCALLRQSEYDDDLRYVLNELRNRRVVS